MRFAFFAAILCAAPLAAQTPEYALRVSIPETGVAVRTKVMTALLAEGLPIGNAAACDCLWSTAAFQPKVSWADTPVFAQLDITVLPDSAGSVVMISAKRSDDGAYVVRRDVATTVPVRMSGGNRRDKIVVTVAQRLADRLAPATASTTPH